MSFPEPNSEPNPVNESGSVDSQNPMVGFARQRTAMLCLMGALCLILAPLLLPERRPLVVGSGIALAVELVSCVAGIVLASSVIAITVGGAPGRQGRPKRAVITVIVTAVVGIAIVLDAAWAGIGMFQH